MNPARSEAGVFWEHVLRYHFACQFAAGKTVVDIACGEGYGTDALGRVARSCLGMDRDEETIARAREKYGDHFLVGNAEEIPCESASVDLVVSFETIEHLPSPACFVAEIARTLKPGGQVIISTPNQSTYNIRSASNPFHCSEMEKDEFVELLARHFEITQIYGQTLRYHFDRLQRLLMPISNTIACFVRSSLERTYLAAMFPHVRDTASSRAEALRMIPESPSRIFHLHPLAVLAEINWTKNPASYVIARAQKLGR